MMEWNGFAAAGVLLLAACSPEPEASGNGVNAVAAAPTATPKPAGSAAPPPPPAAAAPEPAEEGTIPAAFHGVYDVSREACGRPGDGRLTVSARELRFHESVGSVRAVTSSQTGAIRVEADYQGEGESWQSSRELRLSDDGSKITVSGDGTTFDRIRCTEGAL